MLLPGIAFLIVFNVIPMFGSIMAFQKFIPARGFFGSKWVGFENFAYIFQVPTSWQVIRNTLVISLWKIILGLVVPLIFALMLNEVRVSWYKRIVQTIVYIPNFMSWVILGGIFVTLLTSDGIVNNVLKYLGITENPIMFLSSNTWARPIFIATDVWRGYGFGAIIFLAGLVGIDPALYEAASVEGAGRWKQLWHISLPGILPTCILLGTLSLGNILNAGFEQIFTMSNSLIYETTDIIDTYVYRLGLVSMQFGIASAVGLMKSLVSMVLIITSYTLSAKFTDYRIF